MRFRPHRRSVVVIATALMGIGALPLASCDSGAGTPPGTPSLGGRIALSVGAFEIKDVTNAQYTLTVENGDDEVVWTATVDADQYGNGEGSIAYIGSCDANSNPNTVTVQLDALFEGPDGDLVIDEQLYGMPPPMTREVTCLANADVPVEFDITIIIDPPETDGFFTIDVTFADVFCAAKLDCVDALLHNDGTRDQTAVVAMSCGSAGSGVTDTVLYRNDLVVTCDDGQGTVLTTTVNPAAAEGNLTPANGGITGDSGVLFGAQSTPGLMDPSMNFEFWNIQLGIEPGVKGCRLATTATAASSAFPGDTIPSGTSWPLLEWDVELTDATTGEMTCTEHPLGGEGASAGVAAVYSGGSPVSFSYSY